jgi:diaminopimelate dehydrogenase
VDQAARAGGKIAVISVGWDPGLFSVNRLYASAILPQGKDYTFWGKGVSQGHSDAVRRLPGVVDARQYTIPVPEAMDRVRAGENPELTTREKHTRLCYVVAEEGADKGAIEEAIKQSLALLERREKMRNTRRRRRRRPIVRQAISNQSVLMDRRM